MTSIKNTILFLVLIMSYGCNSQRSSVQNQNEFTVFYSAGKYTNNTQKELLEYKNFKRHILFLGLHIDPNNKGIVDKQAFLRNINKFYPNKNDSTLLVLDLENKLFKDLYTYDEGTVEFENAASEFSWMLKTVKKLRPNVKVGLYGLPFRAYYPHSKNTTKLDKVLIHSDYLFPSLYSMYPDKQIGQKRNLKYLNDNLTIALQFGERLNKPVVPFVWNLVHPSNKLYRGELISKNEMIQNINFIKNFSYNNNKVLGIVWWDPDNNSFNRMLQKSQNKIKNKPKELQSELFLEYIEPFREKRYKKNKISSFN